MPDRKNPISSSRHHDSNETWRSESLVPVFLSPEASANGFPVAKTHFQATTSRGYLPSVDAIRALAAFAVVTLHTQPFILSGFFEPSEGCRATAAALNIAALFAVPFFFAAAGYFMGRAVLAADGPDTEFRKAILRAVGILAFWSLIYVPLPSMRDMLAHGPLIGAVNALKAFAIHIGRHPLSIFINGGSYQLWFLSSLAQAACIVWLFAKLRAPRALLALAAGLYVFGLLGQGYDGLLPAHMDLNTRTGPFFALLPVVLGYRLASAKAIWKPRASLLLAFAGLALIVAEVLAVWKWNAYDIKHYYLGSIPLALGLLMAALGAPTWASGSILPGLGRMSLGVYGAHAIFIGWIEEFDAWFMDTPAWQFVYPGLVFLLAWLLSEWMARIPGLAVFCGRRGELQAKGRRIPALIKP